MPAFVSIGSFVAAKTAAAKQPLSTTMMMILSILLLVLCTAVFRIDAFAPCSVSRGAPSCRHFLVGTPTSSSASRSRRQQQHQSSLFAFRKDENENDSLPDDNDGDAEEGSSKAKRFFGGKFPFFARRSRQQTAATNNSEPETATVTSTTTSLMDPPPALKKSLTPEEEATKLRSEAEKIRLEAERMDAELTLRKIEKLERELSEAKKKEGKGDSDARIEELQREMNALQAKMRGEVPKPPPPRQPLTKSAMEKAAVNVATTTSSVLREEKALSEYLEPVSAEDFEETVEMLKEAPSFLKKALASALEIRYDDVDDINVTQLALRLEQMMQFDFSYSNKTKPVFTSAQIEERAKEIRENDGWTAPKPGSVFSFLTKDDDDMRAIAGGNETKLALLSLEYEYYLGNQVDLWIDDLEKIIKDEEWLQPVVDALNKSAVDATIESLYPKCTRKEGQVPSLAQVKQLVTEVLVETPFNPTAQPEAVEGGFIIRGIVKGSDVSGDAVIDAIEKKLAKTNLADKMTVLFTNDFTVFADPDAFETYDPTEVPPILYVIGPDVVREPRRVALSVTSALGLSTSWYLAIYPFLLNPALAKRVEDELALADAGMTPDLAFLTDLSFPLFTTFIGIQLLHEVSHQIAARLNGVKLTVPTFVPSLITGITSSVTTFKEPPKNKEAMFDIAIAGPLVGMLASLLAIAVGSQLTLSSDPSLLPALPLQILRQSTLGGGVIDSILGNGALGVPEGALGTPAVASITIPLHPVAVAGYISLVVNALGLLPVGSKYDGIACFACQD